MKYLPKISPTGEVGKLSKTVFLSLAIFHNFLELLLDT